MHGVHVTAAQVSASMSLGDLVCQCLEQWDDREGGGDWPRIDWARSCRMALTGAVVSGPYAHLQYGVLERVAPGSAGVSVAKKVLMSAAQAPLSISLMFSSVLLLQGRPDLIGKKCNDDLIDTWTAGALYWPAVLSLNFRLAPVHRRPLVGALAGSLWNVYSAYQANKGASSRVHTSEAITEVHVVASSHAQAAEPILDGPSVAAVSGDAVSGDQKDDP